MPTSSPNLNLTLWSSVDQLSDTELSANFTTLDTEVFNRLKRTGTDTLSGTITITGALNFGSSGTIAVNQATITKGGGSYTVVKIAGPELISNIGSATDTAFGIKLTIDSDDDASYRYKIAGSGKQYWGNGTAQDIAIYRESSPETALVAQIGSDVDGSLPSVVVASANKIRKFQGAGLRKKNYVWNNTFDGGDTEGWSTSALTGVTAAATSMSIASSRLEIVTPATNNAGAVFRIFHKFKAGVQYTIAATVSSAANTTPVQIGIGAVSTVYASSAATAMTTSDAQHTTTWTPIADVNEAYFFVRQTAATASTIRLDAVQVYDGSAALSTNKFPVAQTIPRHAINVANIASPNGEVTLFAIPVERGMVANEVCFLTGASTATSITLAQAGIFSVSTNDSHNLPGLFTFTLEAVSNDLEFTYQGLNQPMVFPLPTPFKFTTTGIYYIGLLTSGTSIVLSGLTPSVTSHVRGRGYNFHPLAVKGAVGSLTSMPPTVTSLSDFNSIAYAWIN